MSESEVTIPKKVSLDSLNKMLIGYLRCDADKKEVYYRDVASVSGVSRTDISRNNAFFESFGFLEKKGRGNFILTENGTKYSQYLDWGRVEDARLILATMLKENPLVNKALAYVDIQSSVTTDDLRSRIATIVNVRPTEIIQSGINSLIEMLLFSGLLKESDGKLSSVQITPKKEKEVKMSTPNKEPVVVPMKNKITIPISLIINVTDITNIEHLKEVLKAIQDVFEE